MEPPHKNNGQAEKLYMAILSCINRHFHMAMFIASSTSNSFLVHNIHHSFLFHLPCFPLPSPTRTIMTSTVNFLFLFAKKKACIQILPSALILSPQATPLKALL